MGILLSSYKCWLVSVVFLFLLVYWAFSISFSYIYAKGNYCCNACIGSITVITKLISIKYSYCNSIHLYYTRCTIMIWPLHTTSVRLCSHYIKSPLEGFIWLCRGPENISASQAKIWPISFSTDNPVFISCGNHTIPQNFPEAHQQQKTVLWQYVGQLQRISFPCNCSTELENQLWKYIQERNTVS